MGAVYPGGIDFVWLLEFAIIVGALLKIGYLVPALKGIVSWWILATIIIAILMILGYGAISMSVIAGITLVITLAIAVVAGVRLKSAA